MIVKPQPGEGPAQQLSFVAAVALHLALHDWVPPPRLRLKWPNDLLLDGIKVSGILLEGHGDAVVIGFGVNLAAHPEDSERPATSLPAVGLRAASPEHVLDNLIQTFADTRAAWRVQGFAPLREAWLQGAAGLDEPLVARLGQEDVSGVFEGLADDGALRLRLPDGTVRAIHAGEVFAGV